MASQNQRMERDIARIVARSESPLGDTTLAATQATRGRYRPISAKVARQSIRAAMPMSNREFKEYMKKELSWLTDEQKEAFLWFSQGMYGPLNNGLRYHANPDVEFLSPWQIENIKSISAIEFIKTRNGEDQVNHVRAMDAAFRKSKMPRDVIVYRGVNRHSNKVFHHLREGDVFTDAGYMSTSIEPGRVAGGVADSFTDPYNTGQGGTLLNILVPKGSRAIAIPSKFEKEREILLPRGSKFKVTKIGPGRNGGRVIDMTMQ